jgi:cation diffusion facilitator family transporter
VAASTSSRQVVIAALVGNLLVALTKAVAAVATGSSAMLSEAIHSFIDTGNEAVLLYGLRRAARPPDSKHPLGHGRELYFWSFIVALLIFALGAGVSIFQGVARVRQPQPISHPMVSYVVLALSFLFEGATWLIALRRFDAAKGGLGYYEAFRRSKDPPSFMVLFEDTAALLGILIAAAATFAAEHFHAPVLDGVGSILIGVLLGGTALLLSRESKSLLIGEQADPGLSRSIHRLAEEHPSLRVNGIVTVQLAPDQVLAALSLEFADDLRAYQIEDIVIEIERKLREAHPDIVAVFIKPQTHRAYTEIVAQRFESDGL